MKIKKTGYTHWHLQLLDSQTSLFISPPPSQWSQSIFQMSTHQLSYQYCIPPSVKSGQRTWMLKGPLGMSWRKRQKQMGTRKSERGGYDQSALCACKLVSQWNMTFAHRSVLRRVYSMEGSPSVNSRVPWEAAHTYTGRHIHPRSHHKKKKSGKFILFSHQEYSWWWKNLLSCKGSNEEWRLVRVQSIARVLSWCSHV